MPLFDPDAILTNSDLVGPQKLFGSQPALDDAVVKQGFPAGRFVGGMRKRTGAEVNEWWDCRPTEKLDRSAANVARARKRKTVQPTAA
jgi:hypothetical protein